MLARLRAQSIAIFGGLTLTSGFLYSRIDSASIEKLHTAATTTATQ